MIVGTMTRVRRTIAPPPHPTSADVRIPTALATYHYLKAAQVRRLHSSRGAIGYVRARLKHLGDARIIMRLAQPHSARTGSAAYVFHLATRVIASWNGSRWQ